MPMIAYVKNPETGRMILAGGPTWKRVYGSRMNIIPGIPNTGGPPGSPGTPGLHHHQPESHQSDLCPGCLRIYNYNISHGQPPFAAAPSPLGQPPVTPAPMPEEEEEKGFRPPRGVPSHQQAAGVQLKPIKKKVPSLAQASTIPKMLPWFQGSTRRIYPEPRTQNCCIT